ncbi:MAG TPA: transketolase [Terriglobia bacterium]|nr:transketolase [Terriglobia bacterium]
MPSEATTHTKTQSLSQSELDQLCINTIRFLSVDAVQKANSGHPGLPMGAAAITYVLWTKFLKYNPHDPRWPNRDRFVLSAGHGCMLLYSLLHLTGYDLPLDQIKQFRQWGSEAPGHPERSLAEGIETTTGPLGQGFGNGVGMAIAERYLAAYFNRPDHTLVDYNIYALVSDGDLMEGVSAEAASLAGHLGLSNLIYVYDSNLVSLEGPTEAAYTEDAGKRFEAYGWFVQHLPDGNDLDAAEKAFRAAQSETERPSLIIARTHIGYGSPHKQDSFHAHGSPLGEEEVKLTKQHLGWPLEPAFYIPDAALAHFRQAVDRGGEIEQEWQQRLQAYQRTYPQLAAEWDRYVRGEIPEGWKSKIPVFKPSEGPMATRQASGKVLNAIASSLPTLVGGSADLNPSTDTYLKGCGDFQKGSYGGRNLHFGVREHAMGSAVNGMAVSGLLAYGATFFNFSDYMRPTLRLAALMKAHSIFVYTHDSIFLGEDGPTHQPIEQLASIRAIPNFCLIRPGDANETAVAWRVAIEHQDGPVALVLTRQGLPVLDRTKYAAADGLAKGAYVIADAPGKTPGILLIATGSELSLAVEAFEQLKEEGTAARVVSMPSWDLFEKQPQSYKDEVLPPHFTLRIAIEAGSPLGWERYVGREGVVIGMTRFGASAPYKILAEKFGFTKTHVVEKAHEMLGRQGS